MNAKQAEFMTTRWSEILRVGEDALENLYPSYVPTLSPAFADSVVVPARLKMSSIHLFNRCPESLTCFHSLESVSLCIGLIREHYRFDASYFWFFLTGSRKTVSNSTKMPSGDNHLQRTELK